MRYAAYLVAILAAAGLVYVISQPEADEPSQAAAPTSAEADGAVATTAGDVDGAEKLITLSVPEMHCPFACYPAVKKTLEEQPGVLAVDLAEQKQEGVIDKREVHVKVAGTFDTQSAIDSLSQAGFEKSSVLK